MTKCSCIPYGSCVCHDLTSDDISISYIVPFCLMDWPQGRIAQDSLIFVFSLYDFTSLLGLKMLTVEPRNDALCFRQGVNWGGGQNSHEGGCDLRGFKRSEKYKVKK